MKIKSVSHGNIPWFSTSTDNLTKEAILLPKHTL